MPFVTPTSRGAGYKVPASEWNQNTVTNPTSLHTGEIAISGQDTGDVIVATSSDQLGLVSPDTAGDVLTSNGPGVAPSFQAPSSATMTAACGRLTLTSGTPVTTSDVTAATILYYALYNGNRMSLYNGTGWQDFTLTQLSIPIPATNDTNYDVFLDYNSGTPALALQAWSNATTRVTALTRQDGVYVLTGDAGKRFLGVCRTTGTPGQTESSRTKRFVHNYYNRVDLPMLRPETTDNWNYTTATWRQANNSNSNQLAFVNSVAEDAIDCRVRAAFGQTDAGIEAAVAIGLDSTSAVASGCLFSAQSNSFGAGYLQVAHASYIEIPAEGYHTLTWLEWSVATGTTTWYGDTDGVIAIASGMNAMWRG